MKELYKYLYVGSHILEKNVYAPKFWQKKKKTFVFPQTLFFTTKKKTFWQKKFWSWKIGVGEKQKSFFFQFFCSLDTKTFLGLYLYNFICHFSPIFEKKKERDASKQCQRVIVFQRIMTHVWVLGNFFLKKKLVNTFGFWLQLWGQVSTKSPLNRPPPSSFKGHKFFFMICSEGR